MSQLLADNHLTSQYGKLANRLAGQGAPWLAPIRAAALAKLEELGFPTKKDEAWKYTGVSALLETEFLPALLAPEAEVSFEGVQRFELDCYRMVFVNGRFVPEYSDAVDIKGVYLMPLSQALNDEPELLENMLGTHADDTVNGFAALNTAMISEGLFLHLDRNTVLEKPLHLIFISVPQEKAVASHPRLLVMLDDNAAATLIESHLGLDDAANFTNAVSEIAVGSGAKLEHVKLMEAANTEYHIANIHARVERDGRYISHNHTLGGKLVRNDIHVALTAEGAHAALNGLFMASGNQHQDNHLCVEHLAPRTTSEQFYRGVADERGRGVFNGKVIVAKGAQKIEAKQASNNLLLAKMAEIDTKPELEIYADDVKCAHGATVGQLDQNMLFYLRSRGLDEHTARALLVFAFADAALSKLPITEIRAHLEEKVTGRLPDADIIREFI